MPESIQSVRSMKLYTLQPFCDNVIRACLTFLFCFVSTLVQPIEQALSRKYSMNQLKRTSWLILFLVLSNFFCKLEKKKIFWKALLVPDPLCANSTTTRQNPPICNPPLYIAATSITIMHLLSHFGSTKRERGKLSKFPLPSSYRWGVWALQMAGPDKVIQNRCWRPDTQQTINIL